MGEEDLCGGDLHAEVPARHHDAVHLLENLVVVVEPLLVLDLGDELDAGTAGPEQLAHVHDVGALAHKRQRDHVHLVPGGWSVEVVVVGGGGVLPG